MTPPAISALDLALSATLLLLNAGLSLLLGLGLARSLLIAALRTVLKEKAIAYLCKEEQSIDPLKQSGSERSFTRGIAPRKKSQVGRPRQSDSSNEADGTLEDESCGSEGQECPGDQSTD